MKKTWIYWLLLTCMLGGACIAQTAVAGETVFDPAISRTNYQNTEVYFFESVANALMRAISEDWYGANVTALFEADLLQHFVNPGFDPFLPNKDDVFAEPFFLIWGNCYNFYEGYAVDGSSNENADAAQNYVIQMIMEINEQYADFESIPEAERSLIISDLQRSVVAHQFAVENADSAVTAEPVLLQAVPTATEQNARNTSAYDTRLPTAPPMQSDAVAGEAAVTEYVKFDFRDGYYADTVTYIIPFALAREQMGYESKYVNDHRMIHAEFEQMLIQFKMDFPVYAETGTVVDIKSFAGKNIDVNPYEKISVELGGIRTLFNVWTDNDVEFYSDNSGVKWTTTSTVKPADASLVIEFTSVEEHKDGVTYQGTFSASYGTGETRKKIDNGEFRFTLPFIDPNW